MEAYADSFFENEYYKNITPRSDRIQYKSLDLDILENGQLEPIKVNNKMIILDGYERWQILGDRGIKIKYEIMNFNNENEEINFIVKVNVMRKHLNKFQRVESLYSFYKKLKNEKINNPDEFKKSYVDVINAIKNNNRTSLSISKFTGRNRNRINELLRIMTGEYYLSKKGNLEYEYDLMPKADELLSKQKITATTTMVGKTINVDRTNVGMALYLIDNADDETKQKLRSGEIKIYQAYQNMTGIIRGGRTSHGLEYWGKYTKIRCKHCNNIALKEEYEIVNESKRLNKVNQ